ncbi:hypothetical protein EGR_06245 [Echinococcus granulosus]|uniref:Uncharacterized protein n=1 Tax=Echinococcus granulosus TaxID=6210 RepID=W6UZ86_ECHGR|nr:hypothetical protein EGR_06245 [Echinococcus granulosus]EUB58929.1 hypothetical protein EGR_06245 [Echinococcus granulosus]
MEQKCHKLAGNRSEFPKNGSPVNSNGRIPAASSLSFQSLNHAFHFSRDNRIIMLSHSDNHSLANCHQSNKENEDKSNKVSRLGKSKLPFQADIKVPLPKPLLTIIFPFELIKYDKTKSNYYLWENDPDMLKTEHLFEVDSILGNIPETRPLLKYNNEKSTSYYTYFEIRLNGGINLDFIRVNNACASVNSTLKTRLFTKQGKHLKTGACTHLIRC